LIKIDKNDIFIYSRPTTITMALFSGLFNQTKSAVHEDTNIDDDIAEIEEDIEDSRQQFFAVSSEVSEAAKEALSKRTLSQYARSQATLHNLLSILPLLCII
jgi:hypothetical protein